MVSTNRLMIWMNVIQLDMTHNICNILNNLSAFPSQNQHLIGHIHPVSNIKLHHWTIEYRVYNFTQSLN